MSKRPKFVPKFKTIGTEKYLAIDDILDFHSDLERSTQSWSKVYGWLQDLFINPDFNSEIRLLRKKYNLPENGLEPAKEKEAFVTPEGDKIEFTNKMKPAEEWLTANSNRSRDLNMDLKKIGKKYNVFLPYSRMNVLEYFFFFDSFKDFDASTQLNLLSITDVKEMRSYGKTFRAYDDAMWPVMIRISPYASRNDIIDYIDKMYEYRIHPKQNLYKKEGVSLGTVREKNEEKVRRNRKILSQKNLSQSQMGRIVRTSGLDSYIDNGTIGKIRSYYGKKLRKK
jgi:hypothetical protein